jgi:hypothetical protein
MATDKKWLYHLEASRSALISVLGFHTYNDYKINDLKYQNYNKRAAECLRLFVPYSIQKIDNQSNKVIVLNRDYKPIGYSGLNYTGTWKGGEWVTYEDFDSAIADIDSPEMMALLDACGKDNAGRDWLFFTFNDLTAPWCGRKNAERLVGIIDAALGAMK